ncbi:mediator complex subunit 13 C-terminal-domain-containing protein [Pisolithus croceorrhizus]|nr:mediator complex subunit 13 C-terminal-domain-containing protein [Pisolithus croceorrhizus]
MSLASPLFRQILSTIKRIQKSCTDYPVLFHLLPDAVIAAHDWTDNVAELEAICFSVYQRLPRPVTRSMSREILETGEPTRAYFQEPLLTLSRPITPTVLFSQHGQARSLDVLDRHMFLHVGYRFSSCGKWLLASCVDQRGEGYDVGSWLTQDDVETSAVVQIWNFAAQFARRANIEWRLVITKLGVLSASELDAWIHHLSATVPLCRDMPPFHISILSADCTTSWPLLQNLPSNQRTVFFLPSVFPLQHRQRNTGQAPLTSRTLKVHLLLTHFPFSLLARVFFYTPFRSRLRPVPFTLPFMSIYFIPSDPPTRH